MRSWATGCASRSACARRATRPRRAEPGLADRPAARGRHRRDGAGLGHELVLRHRELGGRDLELVGRGSAPTPGARRWSRAVLDARAGERTGAGASPSRPAGTGGRLRVPRHRRHRRGRRVAARACATSSSSAAAQPDVKFVVISSDVVYPTGAMKDYEANFWLPFKGITKPVYAIPGNHDWYDALEGVRGHLPRAGRGARRRCARASRPTTGSPAPPTGASRS